MNDVLEKILAARDERAKKRARVFKSGKASLSLNLNVPGYPKSDEKLHQFFQQVLSELKRHLIAHRVKIEEKLAFSSTDEAGDFFLAPLALNDCEITVVKQVAEKFEDSHLLGRLIDVDIMDEKGNPVSSGKAKLCFFCNEAPALVCMREKKHSYEEMRAKIKKDIARYLESILTGKVCKDLASIALKALLHEVSLSPKPGLVDRFSNGSHTDMDYATFINSASVLSVYFKQIVEYAYQFNGDKLDESLPELRNIGLQMEEDMFLETNGVNTHKGAVFLFGFSLFVSAYLISNKNFSYDSFAELIRSLNGNLVERELGRKLYTENMTHGEECFEKFGAKGKGIRGEIQAGLPCVFNHAIPVLEKHLQDQNLITDSLLQKSLIHALLSLIANNDDSNILFRKGLETLEALKQKAKVAFENFNNQEFETYYQSLIDFCRKNHISPGGSADLLAVSYFIFTVNKKYGE